MKIGLDLDGVVYPFIEHFDSWMASKGFPTIKHSQYSLGERYGLQEERGKSFLLDYGRTRPFCNMEPYSDAQKGVQELNKRGEIYIISYREWAFNGEEDTRERISIDFPFIEQSKIIISEQKDQRILETGVELMIEDSLGQAMPIVEQTPASVLLIDKSYNQGKLPARIQRVPHDWKIILDKISAFQ